MWIFLATGGLTSAVVEELSGTGWEEFCELACIGTINKRIARNTRSMSTPRAVVSPDGRALIIRESWWDSRLETIRPISGKRRSLAVPVCWTARDDENKGLSRTLRLRSGQALKSCPDTKPSENNFFSNSENRAVTQEPPKNLGRC